MEIRPESAGKGGVRGVADGLAAGVDTNGQLQPDNCGDTGEEQERYVQMEATFDPAQRRRGDPDGGRNVFKAQGPVDARGAELGADALHVGTAPEGAAVDRAHARWHGTMVPA